MAIRKPRKARQPDIHEFDNGRYKGGKIWGAHLPLRRGYGVTAFDFNPASNQANGRMINVKGEKIDFYIEEIEANFEMAGTTGQSQQKRQFFPHNMVMPSITIRGRANNSYQANRLAAFVRVGQYSALNTKGLRAAGVPLRSITDAEGNLYIVPTIRLLIFNGAKNSRGYPYNGRNVKGQHQNWVLEGYVKLMPAGAKRFDPAPAFEFEFMVAESQQNGTNVGIWSDTAVAGDKIKAWIDIFEKRDKTTFVRGGRLISPSVKGENQVQSGASDATDAFNYDDGPDTIQPVPGDPNLQ